jgi:hypothetical protein
LQWWRATPRQARLSGATRFSSTGAEEKQGLLDPEAKALWAKAEEQMQDVDNIGNMLLTASSDCFFLQPKPVLRQTATQGGAPPQRNPSCTTRPNPSCTSYFACPGCWYGTEMTLLLKYAGKGPEHGHGDHARAIASFIRPKKGHWCMAMGYLCAVLLLRPCAHRAQADTIAQATISASFYRVINGHYGATNSDAGSSSAGRTTKRQKITRSGCPRASSVSVGRAE